MAYINALGTTAYLAAGKPRRLYRLVKGGETWSAPELLPGIDSTFTEIDFPFALPDGGTTLIFSARNASIGIGGRDIFITRYNSDTRRFVRPVSLGMPFNSPYNDLLYAPDPTTRRGYLFTDRRQADGKVCRYTFLYDKDKFDELTASDESVRRAAAAILHWRDSQNGQAQRLEADRKRQTDLAHRQTEKTPAFFFVISDDRTAGSLSDFHTPRARELAEKWLELTRLEQTLVEKRDKTERNYARHRSEESAQMLRSSELQLSQLRQEIKILAKAIRRAEHP